MSITCACRPKAISCRASPRNRLETSVCSASAVRFIGTQRPSIAMENDVSTSSATQACVRASVSCTSTSSIRSRTPRRAVGSDAAVALRRGAEHGVGDRLGDVPRLRVAEGPLPGRTGGLPRRAGLAQVPLALPSAHPLGHVAQQGLAELAHRLGRQAEVAVAAPSQVAAVAQRLLEPLQGAGVDGRLVTELAGQLVEVDVVEPGAAVRLGELVGEVVEVGEVLQGTGAVPEAEPLLPLELLGAAPVLTGSQRPEVVVHAPELVHQLR